MKKNGKLTLCAVVLLLALLLTFFAGCGKTEVVTPATNGGQAASAMEPATPEGDKKPAAAGQTETPQTPDEPEEPEEKDPSQIEPGEDGAYHVSSIVELMEAVRPGALITIEPGKYNISDYLDSMGDEGIQTWNRTHGYVRVQDCYDGWELVIQNVPDLCIEGGTDNAADTELVTDPRYAALLYFENCQNVSLNNLTMGHTETGSCAGDVLNFSKCTEIALNNMDLYGCGVYGVGASGGTYDLTATDCIIRDCEYGPFDIFGCFGTFAFYDCTLTGSRGGGYFYADNENACSLEFYRCTFGDEESDSLYYRGDVYTEDCVWSENIEYYDWESDWEPELDVESLVPITFAAEDLGGTWWYGYSEVDQASGETVYLPYEDDDGEFYSAIAEFYEDGNGYLEYQGETINFTWTVEEDEDGCFVVMENDEQFLYATVFYAPEDHGDMLWMLMQVNERLVWLY